MNKYDVSQRTAYRWAEILKKMGHDGLITLHVNKPKPIVGEKKVVRRRAEVNYATLVNVMANGKYNVYELAVMMNCSNGTIYTRIREAIAAGYNVIVNEKSQYFIIGNN